MLLGISSGIVSAIAYSIRNLYSKKILSQYSGYKIFLWFQALVVVLVLFPFIDGQEYHIMMDNVWMLLLLGTLTTALGHGLMVTSLKYFNVGQGYSGILTTAFYAIILGIVVLRNSLLEI